LDQEEKMIPDKVTQLVDRLIAEAKELLRTATSGRHDMRYVTDRELLKKWSNEIILLHSVAGDIVRPWRTRLGHNGVLIGTDEVEHVLATLETIRFAISEGLLTKYQDLVFAEALSDIFQQASYLLSEGYFMAAGVLLRAVLEERLRLLTQRHKCVPPKANPTINDFNMALYGATPPIYDKTMMLNVTALAAVGNDAAHANPALRVEDVTRMKQGVGDFLTRFSM
jgi:hypothetical protein